MSVATTGARRAAATAAVASMAVASLLIAAASTATPTLAATVVFNWTVTETMQALDGVPRMALGINGRPGHEVGIAVRSGDDVVVHVNNGLDSPTALHWHGLLQNGSYEMDGAVGAVQCPIPPGGSFTYRFSTAGLSGTYWWHSHYLMQYSDGLRGPLVVLDSPERAALHPPYDTDTTFQLADWYHASAESLATSFYLNGSANPLGMEPMFDSGLINGRGVYDCEHDPTVALCVQQSPPVYEFAANKTHRLRLINEASYAGFRFSIDEHRLTVIEADGVAVRPYEVDALDLNSGQRYSVLVTANKPVSSYWMRAIMFHGPPWTVMNPAPGFREAVLAEFRYVGAMSAPVSAPHLYGKVLDENDLYPLPARPAPRLNRESLHLLYSFDFQTRPGDEHQKGYVRLSTSGKSFTTDVESLNRPLPPLPNVDPRGASFALPDGEAVLISLARPEPGRRSPIERLPTSANVVQLTRHQIVQLTILNRDPGEHPFHLHGHVFWVVATGRAKTLDDIVTVDEEARSGAAANPPRRDTITVPPCPIATGSEPGEGSEGMCKQNKHSGEKAFGYAVVRFVADNPGVWLFHCHIDWHIIAGLAMVFVESTPDVVSRGVPPGHVETCDSYNAWRAATHWHGLR
ncbi:hypothetical protein HK405_009845, partial [Cladochytrium tenue]